MKNLFHHLKKKPAAVKLAWAFAILFSLNASQSWGQTILFNDNFNTSTGSLYDISGAIGTSTDWSLARSGTDWGARITGNILDFSNTATGSGASNGWVFGYRDINALSGWNTTLSSNTGSITWEFNMRQVRTDPAGFTAGSYGVAFVLAGTSITASSSGSGYAVVLGQSGTTDPVRLVSFDNGLQGTLTNIITSNTSGLTDFGNEYLSVRVTYAPSSNTWQLFLRLDGTTFASITDPATGTLTSQGTAVNSAYTSTAGMRYIGGYWQGSTASNQTAFFDNVYLKKTTPSFTVTFNGNGSTGGSMSNQTASAATNLTSNAFTRTGYTFAGWNTAANGTGTSYANGASFPFTANTTLFAQWTANTLTITYDSQGGSAISNGSTTTGGQIAASPGTPTRAGYTFNGWFTASSGGTAISFPYTHNQTANFTLFAQWTANTLTITYDSQGGSAISNGSTTTGGQIAASPGTPTRAGYTFNGWFTASSGGTAISFPYTHNQTADFTLFAQWTANTLNITYDSQGGSAIANGSTTTGGSIAASPGTPTRAGYTFNGWFTASSGGTAISFPYTHNQTASFTLFAQWTANTLTITFDSQGGSVISNGSTTTGGTVANPGDPTRAGFTFDGWFVAASGGTAITFPYSHGQTANFTLFAQWTVAGSPTLNGATLSSALSNVYGTASSGVNFTASGTFLTGNITVTAQTGYEVSTSSGSGYGASVSIASGTTVWVRFAALQNAGTYNNATAAVLSSAGATPVNVLTSGSGNTVSPKPLSVTAPSIASKVYDATTTAGAVTVGSLSGFVGSQTVTVTGVAANYSSANADTYTGVVITYTLSNGTNGGLAANYSLANGSATGVITPKALSITAPTIASKVYDATTTAGGVTVGTLSGLVGSETLNVTGAAANYSSANAGSYAGVVITYTLINGSGLAANYSLANGSATGVISPKALTITAPSIASKVYDATTTAGAVTVGSLSGLVGSETLTVTGAAANYTSANAGSYAGVVITYTLINGTGLSANYSLANGSATGVVMPKALTITAPSIASKAYDAATTAGAVTVGTLSGFVGIETVTATGSAAAYSSANVGTYTNVTVSYTLVNGTNGGLATNYSLAAGSATGVITQRALTITATDATKEIYQVIIGGAGSTAFTSSGLQGGQTIGSVTIAYGAAAGSTGQGATPGTYAGQTTPSAATGGTFNAANYSITYVAGAIIVTNPNAMVLATLGTAVCENFSGLATSGTSSTMPTGWAFSESGTNANSTYTAGTGSSNAGDTYSFGTSGDRTLGGLQSGSLNPTYGARIFNNTGSTISTITIAYTGKTWRVGAASRSDRIDFQYSTNATSLTTGTWTDENNLDYANPGQANTGSGSLQHSANISYTMQGLSVAPGTSIWIRWTDFDVSGSDDGMGVDDVCITPIVPCTAPDLLAFNVQPSNVQQDAVMSTVTVRAYCSSNGFTASGFTGNITLAASGGGCGYVSQTVAAVNGVATFNNIVFTRSAQTGITLTASASGFSDVISSSFNVTVPAGSITTVSQQDFGSNTTLSYSTTVGGVGVFNTSNTRGVSGSNCLAFYYDACLSGATGSSSTANFTQSSGLSGLNNLKLNFSMAWGGAQLAGANCDATSFSGTGLDNDDFVRLETSINGGAFVTTFQINGNSNKQYGFTTSGVSLNHNANQTLSSATEPSAFTINLPSGTTSVNFRFTFKTNRRNEIIYLDNFSIQGNASGTPQALPVANAGISFNGCNGGPNQLQGSALNTVGAVDYSWSPSASLLNSNTSSPQATNISNTTYTLTVTDADNCKANSTVTVFVLNGTAGFWTGAENTDWFNCQNWASGSVPGSSTDVVISSTTNIPDISASGALCRNLSINSGATLNMSSAASQLSINGNFTNNGTFLSAGTLLFNGTVPQSISGTNTFQNLMVSNAAGVTLNNNIIVNGTVDIQAGNLQTMANKVTLGSSAIITETQTAQILGEVEMSRTLGLANETFGGLGIEIDADDEAPGVTVVKRFTGTVVSSGVGQGISLKYSIVPANNANLDATLVFRYKDADLNGLDKNNFQLYRSVDGGIEWTEELAIGDPDNNMLTKTNISSFSEWTAADVNIPLPVNLMRFSGKAGNLVADLSWTTASEQDNAGFRVYKSADGQKYELLAFLEGAVNSLDQRNYRLRDVRFTQSSYYKLTMVDGSGKESSGKVLFLDCQCANRLQLKVSPNPGSGDVHFSSNQLVTEQEVFQLELRGMDGKMLYQNHTGLNRLEELLNERLRSLPSGIYHLRLFNARVQEKVQLQRD